MFKNMYKIVHSSTIHNTCKVETTIHTILNGMRINQLKQQTTIWIYHTKNSYYTNPHLKSSKTGKTNIYH